MNKHTVSLSTRRASLSKRFAAFRQIAAASVLSATVDTMPRPTVPQCPRVWVAKRTPAAPFDPLDAPLPADFTPAPFEPFVSTILTLDAATEAEIKRESDAEIAALFAQWEAEDVAAREAKAKRIAVSFVSDLTPQGVDFAPDGTHGKTFAPVKRVTLPRVHNRPASAASIAVRPIGQANVKPLAGFAALAAALLAAQPSNT